MFENVGNTLRLIRELRGKSQAGTARLAGIGKTQLSKYENAKELPKLPTLKKILAVYLFAKGWMRCSDRTNAKQTKPPLKLREES